MTYVNDSECLGQRTPRRLVSAWSCPDAASTTSAASAGRGSPLGFHSGCFKKEAEERRVVTRQTDRQGTNGHGHCHHARTCCEYGSWLCYFGVREFVCYLVSLLGGEQFSELSFITSGRRVLFCGNQPAMHSRVLFKKAKVHSIHGHCPLVCQWPSEWLQWWAKLRASCTVISSTDNSNLLLIWERTWESYGPTMHLLRFFFFD